MESNIVSKLVAAGKKTDADTTDRTIVTTGFKRIIIDCTDATSEMTFTIDENISGAEKPIYVSNGNDLDLNVLGTTLHYEGAGTFRYILLN